MKLANALLLLAIIATASGLYLGRREVPDATPPQPSSEVAELRRELAKMKDKVAELQASGAESSDD